MPSPSTPFMVINVPSGPEASPKKPFRSALPTQPAMRLHEDLMPVHPAPMPPVAAVPSVPPPAKRSRMLPMLGAGLLLLAGAVVIGPSLVGGGSGKMLVTVSGPGNRQVDALEIFVDGQKRCSTSPCRVSGLETGKHFVQVKAPGYEQSSELPVAVEGGADPSSIHVPLSQAAAGKIGDKKVADSAGPDEAEQKDEAKGVDPERAGVAVDGPGPVAMSRPRGPTRTSSEASGPEPKPADDTPGTLRINSVPLSKVLVDGRPLGHTPKIIKVSPGPHTVVLVGPTGRAVRNVNVEPGKAVAVGVRF